MISAFAMVLGLAVSSPSDYLCDVYNRTPTKQDAAGDFSWKDLAAAKKKKMDLCEYVVGGMNPKLRDALVEFGKLADEAGMPWSFSSGFRDDYRQSIASGIKARTGYSMHGGSKVTSGYGDGRAVDLSLDGPIGPLLKLFDSVGGRFGLTRPFKGFDPCHVQMGNSGKAKTKRKRRRR